MVTELDIFIPLRQGAALNQSKKKMLKRKKNKLLQTDEQIRLDSCSCIPLFGYFIIN